MEKGWQVTEHARWTAAFLGGMAIFTGLSFAHNFATNQGASTTITTGLLVGVVLSLVAALAALLKSVQVRAANEEDFNPAMMTWTRRFVIIVMGYMVAIFAASWMLQRFEANLVRMVAALLPVLPILFGIRIFVQTLGRLDEMQQRIQLEAFAISVAGTGATTFTLGMLSVAGFPNLNLTWVFPMLMGFWGLGVWFTTRKYNA